MSNALRRSLSALLALCMSFSCLAFGGRPAGAAAEEPPASLSRGEILYENGFDGEEPLSGWTTNGNYAVAPFGEGHRLVGASPDHGGQLIAAGALGESDYVVSTVMNTSSAGFNAAAGGASAGIVFRYVSSTQYYHLRLDSSAGGVELRRWNGSSTVLTKTPFSWEKDRDYVLTVVAQGNYFRCYIDGSLILTYEDTAAPIPAGTVGFRTYDCTTAFDDLTVYALSAPQVTLSAPTAGETATEMPLAVTGTADSVASRVELKVNGGDPISLTPEPDGTFSHELYLPNGDYTVTATPHSYKGLEGSPASVSFTVDVPTRPLTGRLQKTVNVGTDESVALLFDAPVREDTVSNENIRLLYGGDSVEATVALSGGDPSGRTVILTPEAALSANTTYHVTISNVRDVLGNALAEEPLTLAFQTVKDINTLPPLAEAEGEAVLSLNGLWHFKTDSARTGERAEWYKLTNLNDWDALTVPGNWDLENAYANYSGQAWYHRTFQVPEEYAGYPVYLDLTAVYHDCKVWVNGQLAGTHSGGYTTFQLRVDQLLNFGDQENTIAILVDNTYSVGAWWKWGGISGGALLRVNNPSRLEWQHIVSEPDLETDTAHLSIEYKIDNRASVAKAYTVVSQIYDKAAGVLAGEASTCVTVLPSSENPDQRFTATVDLEDVTLWHFDDPNLYTVETWLYDGNGPVHHAEDNIGIRKIEIKDTKFYINGEQVRLTGADRVWDDRVNGQTEPDYVIMRDIDYMKSMGMNCARLSHIPMSKNLLNYCDEVGFLLICESNVWGGPPGKNSDGTYKSESWYREMIERDFNHPAIFAWSIGNEMHGGNQATKDYAQHMVPFIKDLDPSRLVTEVSLSAQNPNDPNNPQGDSVYYSDFVCCNFYGGFRDNVLRVHNTYPDKAIFISEYGNGQTSEIPDKAVIRPQAILDAWGDLPYVFGAAIWTLNDYRSSYGGTPLGQNRVWGVTTVWGDKKIGFEALRKASSPVKSLTVTISGDTGTEGATALALIEAQIKNLAEDLPAYPLRGALVKWEALDRAGAVFASGLEELPDMQPDGSVHIVSAVLTGIPSGGTGAVRATVVDSLGYEVAETVQYLLVPSAAPVVTDVITAETSARVLFAGVPNAVRYLITATAEDGTTATATAQMNRYADFAELNAGETYSFTVTAGNAVGTGSSSAPVRITLDSSVSTLPPIIWHTEPVEGAFFVGYSVKAQSDTYELKYGTSSGSYAHTASFGTEGSVKLSGLTGGQTYYYRLRSLTDGVPSAWSQEVAVTAARAEEARAVPVVRGAAAGEHTVSLTIDPVWKATGYTVQYGTAPDTLDQSLFLHRAEVAQLTVSGLDPERDYYFAVASHNGDTRSAFSAPVATRTSSGGGAQELVVASVGTASLALDRFDNRGQVEISASSTYSTAKTLTVKVEDLPAELSVPEELSFQVEPGQSAAYHIPVTVDETAPARIYLFRVSVLDGEHKLAERQVSLSFFQAEVLLSDDFSEEVEGRYTLSGKSGSAAVTGGKLVMDVSKADDAPIVTAGQPDWSGYTVESRIQITDNTRMGSGISAGLVFRYLSDENFCHARIDMSKTSSKPSFQVYQWKDGKAASLYSAALSGEWNDTYHIRVSDDGDTVRFYLDGVLMTTLTTSELGKGNGKVGYRAYSARAELDDLRVFRLVPPQADKTALQALVDACADYAQGDYTAESYAVFAAKRTAAQAVLDDDAAAQAAVDQAFEELSAAIVDLVAQPPAGPVTDTGIKTTTRTEPDGTVITTVTNIRTGTVTVTTRRPDGSSTVEVTQKDGTVITTEASPDRVVTETTALPDGAVTAKITLPTGMTQATVTIPVARPTPGMVAVAMGADGEERVLPLSLVTETGVRLVAESGLTVRIEDRGRDFRDVSSSAWYWDSVRFVTARALFQGTGAETFAPDLPMDRAMLLTVLYRLDGQRNGTGGATWYSAAADWAVETGISDGSQLNAAVSREQLAAMLYRYAGIQETVHAAPAHSDAGEVSAWASEAMAWAVETGILSGRPDGRLAPQDSASRAEVAAMLMRFVRVMVESQIQ
jgi:beta-galactosidase